MNLETFKARARRKLALPGHSAITPKAAIAANPVTPASPSAQAQTTTTEPKNAHSDREPTDTATDAPNDAPPSDGRFAAAKKDTAKHETAPLTNNDIFATRAPQKPGEEPTPVQSLTGSATHQTASSEAQLDHLRSFLLGNEQAARQDQVEDVYRRTQSDINGLRQDMDARLTDLSNYVKQLDQSLLNNLESQNASSSAELSDQNAQALATHDQRLDALDTRITELLEKARSELGERRAANRDHLETKLAAISDHGDRQLSAVSKRLEASITDMQTKISAQLSSQSANAVVGSESSISDLHSKLEMVINERVRSFNDEQTSGMRKLRDVMLAHTGSIKAELKTQTETQSKQLTTHRKEMETQFNSALTALNRNKVSHKELSQLLTRLADRIKQL